MMKNLFSLATGFLALQLAAAAPNDALARLQAEIAKFEQDFSATLGYELNNTIRLLGYKKIQIPPGKANHEFSKHYQNEIAPNRHVYPNHFYDPQDSVLRVYFPVQEALVNHGDTVTQANHLGELPFDSIHGDCAVLGRKQTTDITGVEGNIIRDGVIYLSEAVRPVRKHGLVYVYDMGEKDITIGHDHGSLHKRDGKKACINNHGGPNCSDKFGIHKGRCPFKKNVCMDYNGWATNCKDSGWRKYLNFPGSDCDYALGRGQCWNEVM